MFEGYLSQTVTYYSLSGEAYRNLVGCLSHSVDPLCNSLPKYEVRQLSLINVPAEKSVRTHASIATNTFEVIWLRSCMFVYALLPLLGIRLLLCFLSIHELVDHVTLHSEPGGFFLVFLEEL